MNVKRLAALVCAALMLLSLAACGSEEQTPASDPVTITIWTYYNGSQLEAFTDLITKFNDTVGRENSITVESYSQGSVADLEKNVVESAEGKVGAAELPNIFSAYADTAYALDQMGQVVDLSEYLTDAEKEAFIDDYLKEGDFSGNGSIKILPTAKSTELLFLNETDWAPFAEATGAAYDDLSTIEGLVATAERYYEWTDSLTPEPGDGRAFFGRDAMANYILIGARQLGCTIFDAESGKMTLDFDHDAIRCLWDNYYVPYIKGYFTSSGKFRSDDLKTGNIIAYVGSSSSSAFFPDQVITGDNESHDIERTVLPAPKFSSGSDTAVQQGAGMVVTKASEAEIRASLTFLKWFTSPENNIAFSINSGYMPVTKAASTMEAIRGSGLELSPSIENVLTAAVETIDKNELYTPRAFEGGMEARNILEYSLSDKAVADRAEVLSRMEAGQSFEQASAEFLSDECFESWYQDVLTQLEAYEG